MEEYRLPAWRPTNTLKEAQTRLEELETIRAAMIVDVRGEVSILLPFLDIYEKSGNPTVRQRIATSLDSLGRCFVSVGTYQTGTRTSLVDLDMAIADMKALIEVKSNQPPA
jgi:hypothetical protein